VCSTALLYHNRFIQPFLSANRSARSGGERLCFHLSVHLHSRDRGQTICRACARAGCAPSPRRGGRRLGARSWTAAGPAGDLHCLGENGSGGGALLGPDHHCRPVLLLSPLARLHRDCPARLRPAHHPSPGNALCLCSRHSMGPAGHRGGHLPGLPAGSLCSCLRARGPAHWPHRLCRRRLVSATARCPAALPWIDRRFFREAYSVDQVLVELSEQARSFTETEPLLRTITERIGQTLHVQRISFLCARGKLFQLEFAQGIPSHPRDLTARKLFHHAGLGH
jgi:hypothetical protein